MKEMYNIDRQERDMMYNLSTHFHINYNKRKKYEDIFNLLLSLVGSKNTKELWCLITNIARAIKQNAIYLKIPKEYSRYTGNKQGINARKMALTLDNLCEQGYLVFYKGGFINVKKQDYTPSLYLITDKMKMLWEGVDIEEELAYNGDVIEIKDRETKEHLNSKISGTANMRSCVMAYNKLLCTVDLELDGITLPKQQYKRVFSGSLKYGGRFYNLVGGVQTMKQSERKRLMINKECVVELDFKSLHPSILYEQLWQDDPRRVSIWVESAWDGVFNPYCTKGYEKFLRVDNDEVFAHIEKYGLDKYNPVRNLFKFAVMTCLNAQRGKDNPVRPAAGSLTVEWYEDKKKPQMDRKYVGLYPVGDKFSAHKICEHIKEINTPIDAYFFSDIGVVLQRMDSDIMEIIIAELVQLGEPIYPEHDSVIVRESIENDVVQIMKKAYLDVVGSDKFCVVEKK